MVREVLALADVEGLFGYTGLGLSRRVDTVRSGHESFPFERSRIRRCSIVASAATNIQIY
jgi:hypothetical protein